MSFCNKDFCFIGGTKLFSAYIFKQFNAFQLLYVDY